MAFRLAADLILLLHLLFVLFVVFGGLLAFRWPRTVRVHLPMVLWGAAVEFFDWICPLTPLENWLRRMGGEAGYADGFIETYLLPLLYPAALTRKTQLILGLFAVAANLAIYGAVLWCHRRK